MANVVEYALVGMRKKMHCFMRQVRFIEAVNIGRLPAVRARVLVCQERHAAIEEMGCFVYRQC
jgi:hypothetical protein